MPLPGVVFLAVFATPSPLAAQSELDTAVVHSIYGGEPQLALLSGVASLVKGAFDAAEAERIHKEVGELSSQRSDRSPRQMEKAYAYSVRVGHRPIILEIRFLSTQSYRFDVMFKAPDAALMKAIRARIQKAQIDPLTPLDRARLSVHEERPLGMQPRLILAMETGRYPCLGYYMDYDMRQEGSTIYLNLHGVGAPFVLCPQMVGPAEMSRELTLGPGKYALVVAYRRTSDRLLLDVSDSATVLTSIESSLVEADERVWWRYPRSTFAFRCVNVEVARAICADVEWWLARQEGISQIVFPASGVNPYRPSPENRPEEGTTYFRYAGDFFFERLRPCFKAIDDQIREAVGVALTLENWKGEEIAAVSTRAYHERHIERPERVTENPACRPPPPREWKDQ
jgi:hypothetical protein